MSPGIKHSEGCKKKEEREFKTLAENNNVKIEMNVKKQPFTPLLEKIDDFFLEVEKMGKVTPEIRGVFIHVKYDMIECMNGLERDVYNNFDVKVWEKFMKYFVKRIGEI